MSVVEVHYYRTAGGRIPVTHWLHRLRDEVTASRIASRIDRLSGGLRGDWRYVGEGVFELRIDIGPGYRVYFGQDGPELILLLCAGTKKTQSKDIDRAHAYWKDYKERAP